MKMPGGNPRAALVAFQSPLRIVSQKELFQSLTFETFIRFLARRLSNMAQIYMDFVMELDEQEMMERAAEIQCTAALWRDVPFSRYIIDSYGEISREVDLAVYDETYTPYIFNYGKIKFIPIEAVFVAIQCKSQIDKRS